MSDNKIDIAQLEMAFAKDPTLEACLTLAGAYLSENRFMEAMVVCKKGIRNHPDSVDGKLLLARIYSEQGKVPKAIQEIESLLQQDEKVAGAYCLLGKLHERAGRQEESIASFKQAIILDRGQIEAVESLKRKGVDFDPGPTPEELEAQRLAEEEAKRQQAEEAKRLAKEEAQRKAEQKAIAQAEHNRKLAEAALGQDAVANASGQALSTFSPSFLGTYDPHTLNPKKKQQNLKFTITMAAVGGVLLVFLLYMLSNRSQQVAKIQELLKSAKTLMETDATADLREAAEKYEEILLIEDDEPVTAARLAWIYQILVAERGSVGDDGKAKEAIERAEKVAPEQWYTAAASAMRFIRNGKLDEARDRLNTVRAMVPDGRPLPPRFRMVEGELLLRSQKHGQLQPIFDELKEKNDPAILYWLGRTWRYLGDNLRAQVGLSAALRFSPNHDPARAERGLLGLDTSNIPMSRNDMSHLFDLGVKALGPRQAAYAKLVRSEVHRLAGEKEQSNGDFSSIPDAFQRDPEYLSVVGARQLAAKKPADAVTALKAAIKIKPFQLGLRSRLIGAAASARDKELAESTFVEANKLFPKSVDLHVARIRALLEAKNIDMALSFANESVEALNKAELHREVGRIYLAKKDYPKATKALTKAAELSTSTTRRARATIYVLLGRAQAKLNDHGSAIEAYGQAIKSDGNYAQGYYWMGLSLSLQNNEAAAKEAFQRVLKLEPTGKVAKFAQRRLEALSE
jgi:cellulose synthase operon protein C